jgi:acyl dehydratase
MGMSVRALLRAFAGDDPGAVASVKVRFARHVLPGDVLLVEAWADDATNRIIFQTRVEDRNVLALSHAALTLRPGSLRQARL